MFSFASPPLHQLQRMDGDVRNIVLIDLVRMREDEGIDTDCLGGEDLET